MTRRDAFPGVMQPSWLIEASARGESWRVDGERQSVAVSFFERSSVASQCKEHEQSRGQPWKNRTHFQTFRCAYSVYRFHIKCSLFSQEEGGRECSFKVNTAKEVQGRVVNVKRVIMHFVFVDETITKLWSVCSAQSQKAILTAKSTSRKSDHINIASSSIFVMPDEWNHNSDSFGIPRSESFSRLVNPANKNQHICIVLTTPRSGHQFSGAWPYRWRNSYSIS